MAALGSFLVRPGRLPVDALQACSSSLNFFVGLMFTRAAPPAPSESPAT